MREAASGTRWPADMPHPSPRNPDRTPPLFGSHLPAVCLPPPFLQVPKDAVPVRIEFQLTTAPLEITLDVEKGCLDSDDAKRLLGLSPHAEVR